MFHVERHHRGRLAGTPSRRGQVSVTGATRWRTAAPTSPRRTILASPNPRVARPAGDHRTGGGPVGTPGSAAGGSVTIRRPFGVRKPAAHSAVTAGGPKDRATTT